MQNNPHLIRLKRGQQAKFPASRLPWFLLGACSTQLSLVAGLRYALQLWSLLTLFTLILMATVPIIMAGYAATFTARDATPSRYDLLKLTPLSNRVLAWSYFYAALWRLRTLLWLLVILASATVAGILWMTLRMGAEVNIVLWIAFWGMVMLQLLGWCWALVALGVAVALRWQHTHTPTLVAPLLAVLLVGVGQSSAYFWYTDTSAWKTITRQHSLWAIATIATPYLIMGVGLLLARRWAR